MSSMKEFTSKTSSATQQMDQQEMAAEEFNGPSTSRQDMQQPQEMHSEPPTGQLTALQQITQTSAEHPASQIDLEETLKVDSKPPKAAWNPLKKRLSARNPTWLNNAAGHNPSPSGIRKDAPMSSQNSKKTARISTSAPRQTSQPVSNKPAITLTEPTFTELDTENRILRPRNLDIRYSDEIDYDNYNADQQVEPLPVRPRATADQLRELKKKLKPPELKECASIESKATAVSGDYPVSAIICRGYAYNQDIGADVIANLVQHEPLIYFDEELNCPLLKPEKKAKLIPKSSCGRTELLKIYQHWKRNEGRNMDRIQPLNAGSATRHLVINVMRTGMKKICVQIQERQTTNVIQIALLVALAQ